MYSPFGFTVRHLRSKGFHRECVFLWEMRINKLKFNSNEARVIHFSFVLRILSIFRRCYKNVSKPYIISCYKREKRNYYFIQSEHVSLKSLQIKD